MVARKTGVDAPVIKQYNINKIKATPKRALRGILNNLKNKIMIRVTIPTLKPLTTSICTVPDLIMELYMGTGIFLFSPKIIASNMLAVIEEVYLKIKSCILPFKYKANL